jgi:hypothetical protein
MAVTKLFKKLVENYTFGERPGEKIAGDRGADPGIPISDRGDLPGEPGDDLMVFVRIVQKSKMRRI